MYKRSIEAQVKNWLFKNEVVIIYGARQVGKTTFALDLARQITPDFKYIDCDLISNRLPLSSQDLVVLQKFIGDSKVVIIDEAQRVENIGINLKILHTYFKETQFIATGSSSFDLANKINEPLTGRNIKFEMYPLSLSEISQKHNTFSIDLQMDQILRYGLYPGIFEIPVDDKKTKLRIINQDYLFRDVLATELVKKMSSLENLVRYLALNIGHELSYNNIAQKLQMDKKTVEKYIVILEQAFVIFRLKSLHRNIVKEIRNPFKVYFWDLGIRNAVLDNFLPLTQRDDTGSMWENFCVVERIKKNTNNNIQKKYYFWRTDDKKEYDLIEEIDGSFLVLEIKWNEEKKARHHPEFFETYKTINQDGRAITIHKGNWSQWLI